MIYKYFSILNQRLPGAPIGQLAGYLMKKNGRMHPKETDVLFPTKVNKGITMDQYNNIIISKFKLDLGVQLA